MGDTGGIKITFKICYNVLLVLNQNVYLIIHLILIYQYWVIKKLNHFPIKNPIPIEQSFQCQLTNS